MVDKAELGHLPRAGQAGASIGVASSNQVEAAALRFGSHEDALNFARDGIKCAHDWGFLNPIELVEEYRKGELGIVLKFASRPDLREWDFIFFPVVEGLYDPHGLFDDYPSPQNNLIGLYEHGGKEPVLIGVTQLIEGPEGVIPSLMRLERAKQRTYLRREVFAPCRSGLVESCGRVAEGEIGVFGTRFSAEDRRSVTGLVERGAKSFDSLGGAIGPTVGDFARELQRMGGDAIRIHLGTGLVWFLFEEGFDTLFEPTYFGFCAR
jgi:hypothetical protein